MTVSHEDVFSGYEQACGKDDERLSEHAIIGYLVYGTVKPALSYTRQRRPVESSAQAALPTQVGQ